MKEPPKLKMTSLMTERHFIVIFVVGVTSCKYYNWYTHIIHSFNTALLLVFVNQAYFEVFMSKYLGKNLKPRKDLNRNSHSIRC